MSCGTFQKAGAIFIEFEISQSIRSFFTDQCGSYQSNVISIRKRENQPRKRGEKQWEMVCGF
jgi:hypothetical protein